MAKGIKTGGRVKGTPNKLTASVKEAITEAFEQAGGVAYLLRVANEDPRTFCTLLGKIVPMQTELTGADGGPIQTESRSSRDLAKAVAAMLAKGLGDGEADGEGAE